MDYILTQVRDETAAQLVVRLVVQFQRLKPPDTRSRSYWEDDGDLVLRPHRRVALEKCGIRIAVVVVPGREKEATRSKEALRDDTS